jgi:hypothetical protein
MGQEFRQGAPSPWSSRGPSAEASCLRFHPGLFSPIGPASDCVLVPERVRPPGASCNCCDTPASVLRWFDIRCHMATCRRNPSDRRQRVVSSRRIRCHWQDPRRVVSVRSDLSRAATATYLQTGLRPILIGNSSATTCRHLRSEVRIRVRCASPKLHTSRRPTRVSSRRLTHRFRLCSFHQGGTTRPSSTPC